MVCAFREADAIVLRVVTDAVLFPRHGRKRMFFVDAVAVSRGEGFSELLQNALTGPRVQSFVLWMRLQLVFQVAIVVNLARFLPDSTGVVVRNVPQLAGTPRV